MIRQKAYIHGTRALRWRPTSRIFCKAAPSASIGSACSTPSAPDWRVLLSHLILFGFIYPGERQRIPHVVLARLLRRVHEELDSPGDGDHLCQGTLISRAQYLPDIERWDHRDARTLRGKITAEEIEKWTNAIGRERAWA